MHLTLLMRTLLYRGTFRNTRKNIMTTSKKFQEVLEDLKVNTYYDKYAEKIAKLRKENSSQFKSRLEEISKQKNKKIEPPKERQYSQLNPKEKVIEPIQLKHEPLGNIMKIDLIKDKDVAEIKFIWEQYHKQKDYCIAAIIPKDEYKKFQINSQKFPTFLFALPRSQGYEFIMCQFAANKVHFTPLLYYQVHKENAPECLTITHYDELMESKGVVLMRGEYDTNILNAHEAQCLANQLQMYYILAEPEKIELLEKFTQKSEEFKHMDLIKQIESLSLN